MTDTSKVKIYLINAYSNYDPEKYFISGSDKVAISFANEDPTNSIIVGPKILKKLISEKIRFISSQDDFTKNIITDYIVRTINTIKILKSLGRGKIILTSSDFFCDVIPAFLNKNENYWYAFTFHLYPSFHINFKLRDLIGKVAQDLSYILFRKADKIFTSNFECVEYLRDKFNLKNLYKIPLGVNIKDYKINPQKSIDILFLGRIKESKGIFDLPEIVSIVKSKIPKLNVVVIGNGPKVDRDRVEKLDSDFNTEIKFLGSVDDSTLFDNLSNSKLLIQLDSEGGFGLNIVEALASGCFVVGYELPSYRDNFPDLEIYMFSQNDKQAVALKIIELIQDFKNPLNQRDRLKRFDWASIYKLVFLN